MSDYLIHFDSVEWDNPNPGIYQKLYTEGDKTIRLLRFDDSYMENDWCIKNHVGYVLQGEMNINFDGIIKHFKKGDGLWITKGESSKHKVTIGKGKQVELVLFETA